MGNRLVSESSYLDLLLDAHASLAMSTRQWLGFLQIRADVDCVSLLLRVISNPHDISLFCENNVELLPRRQDFSQKDNSPPSG